MILWFIPKPSSCEFPVGHHILTTTINLAAFPSTETEPFLPLCLDCQSCNPATLRFCPVALTNIIQLVLSPCRKSSKNNSFLDNHFCYFNFPLFSLDFFSFVEWTRSHHTSTLWAFPHLQVLTSQQLQSLTWHKTNPHSQSSHFIQDVPNTNHILCSQHFRTHLLVVLLDLTP